MSEDCSWNRSTIVIENLSAPFEDGEEGEVYSDYLIELDGHGRSRTRTFSANRRQVSRAKMNIGSFIR